ncbi:MAG: hypothetical protein ACYDAE_00790 [Steroidobacteraceae bacterium]
MKEGRRTTVDIYDDSSRLTSPGLTTGKSTRPEVPVLWIGTAERVSAVVEMNHPGVWVLVTSTTMIGTRDGHRVTDYAWVNQRAL